MSAKLQVRRGPRRNESVAVGRALYGLLATVVRSQPRDVSLTALSTLSTLEQTGPRRITDLATTEGVAQPSMTALVSSLERSGLVERRADPNDGRVVLVALSPGGLAYFRSRQRAVVEEFAQLIGRMPASHTDALVAAIPALQRLQQMDEAQRSTAGLSASPRALASGS